MVTIHRMHGESVFYIIRVEQPLYHNEIRVTRRRRLTGTPYSSFTYQRNPSDPMINPSPISMSCIFFYRAQTICCLKLAIAFDAQSSRPGIAPFLDGGRP
jgi:hypothetical protein